jgi:hypothetical protein
MFTDIILLYFIIIYVYYIILQYKVNYRITKDEPSPYERIEIPEFETKNEPIEEEIQTANHGKGSGRINWSDIFSFILEILQMIGN